MYGSKPAEVIGFAGHALGFTVHDHGLLFFGSDRINLGAAFIIEAQPVQTITRQLGCFAILAGDLDVDLQRGA